MAEDFNVTRKQLQSVCGDDHDLLRKFENLFAFASTLSNASITQVIETSDNGSAIGQQALDQFANLTSKQYLTSGLLDNIAILVSVAGNALTIALKQANGLDPTNSAIVHSSFRSSTLTTGNPVTETVMIPTSLTVPSGSTLGHSSAIADSIYVYELDNAGTVELAVSAEDLWDEGLTWSTTALSGASNSRTTLYSTIARSNVAIRFIGRIDISEATAGTWATGPIAVGPPNSDRLGRILASASAVALGTATPLTITSLTLPPGNWEVWGAIGFTPALTTSVTGNILGSISLTNNTLGGSADFGQPNSVGEYRIGPLIVSPTVYANTLTRGFALPATTMNLKVSTTVYLVAQAVFITSTLTATAWMEARRLR